MARFPRPLDPIRTLVLIDAHLPGLRGLLAGLAVGCRPVLVRADQDATSVLAAAVALLRSRGQLPGGSWQLAVLAHGSPGQVSIGRSPLTPSSVLNARAAWQGLMPASIALFSCFAGADPSLQAAFSRVVGVPVAASSRAVGHPALSGTWQLDPPTAADGFQASLPFHPSALEAWPHTLATLTVGDGQTYTTIQAAITAAAAGDIVDVRPGSYIEQVVIDRSLTLRSTGGAAVTSITSPGSPYGAAIRVPSGVQNVVIGNTGQGFTLSAGASDYAALYLVANNDGAVVRGNIIQGVSGTHALLIGPGQQTLTIDANTISGAGAAPLAYVNGNTSYAGNASSGVSFTGNNFTGSGSAGLLLGTEAANSTITGNTFNGVNSYAQLEVWEPGDTISGNSFNGAAGLAIADSGADYTASALAAANTFSPGAITNTARRGVHTSLQSAINGAQAGDTIDVAAGTYAGSVSIPVNNLTLNLAAGVSGFTGAVLAAGVSAVTLAGDGAIALTGNSENNSIVAQHGPFSIVGGAGTDTLSLSSAGSLSDADFTNVTLVEALTLANGSNTVVLAAEAQAGGIVTVTGGTGADAIDASAYTIGLNISSGDGNDLVQLALTNLSSANTLEGGSGTDSLVLASAGSLGDAAFTNVSSFALLKLADGSNTITLAAEAQAAGISSVVGGTGADRIDITAFGAAPSLALGDGSDTVVVAGSFDLASHSGIEVLKLNSTIAANLSGGGGNDTLDGGGGNDGLSGGGGADLFRFSSSDEIGRYSKVDSISDFNPTEGDRIDLSAIASSLGRALTWLGTSSYTGVAGQVRYDSDGGLIGLDLSGSGRSTTSIRVSPGLTIGSSAIVLS